MEQVWWFGGWGHTRATPQQAVNMKVPWSSLAISDSHPCFAEHEQREKGFPSDNQGHLPSSDSHLAPAFLSGKEKLPATAQRLCSLSLSGSRPILASSQRERHPGPALSSRVVKNWLPESGASLALCS